MRRSFIETKRTAIVTGKTIHVRLAPRSSPAFNSLPASNSLARSLPSKLARVDGSQPYVRTQNTSPVSCYVRARGACMHAWILRPSARAVCMSHTIHIWYYIDSSHLRTYPRLSADALSFFFLACIGANLDRPSLFRCMQTLQFKLNSNLHQSFFISAIPHQLAYVETPRNTF
jgi:hypothetical protein